MDVVSLEELDLSKNRLTELKRSALHRLPRLRTVDLSHNQIRSFHSDAFKDTPQVSGIFACHFCHRYFIFKFGNWFPRVFLSINVQCNAFHNHCDQITH